ncbi:MAG: T9SS type A sorting domain-containing protein, partial [Calditrichaeota bacterium]|nr:T9SS type A sorting domain-containing protein [Calditrichota bacterium]
LFNSDIRSPLGDLESENWLMTVRTGRHGDVTLTWDDIEIGTPDGYDFVLIDTETDEEINMNDSDSYTYNSRGTHDFLVRASSPPPERQLGAIMEFGWNILSINIDPGNAFLSEGEDRGPDIIGMMEQLRIDEDTHHIQLMKNEDGQFYLPAFEFNNIPYWDLTEGYQVKVDEDVEAVWEGYQISAGSDIPLEMDWNLIAYFPTYELDASAPDYHVLSPIIDHVIMAKDSDGRFMLPLFNFSNMLPWQETKGYHVKVDEDVVLNYPEENEHVNGMASNNDLPGLSHWKETTLSSENMSILISSVTNTVVSENFELGAYTNSGMLVGAGRFDDQGRCGIAVWGDDEFTDEVEGLTEGEAFSLKLWNGIELKDLNASTVSQGEGLVYSTNGFTMLDVSEAELMPEEFYLSQAYPNPFNSTMRVNYGLPVSSDITLSVYDATGRLVATLFNGNQSIGNHTVIWEASDIAAGIYLVRMQSGDGAHIRKVTLLK